MAEQKSYLVRAGWYMAVILASMVAFAGTGPSYHASVEAVRAFTIDQYGYLMADIVTVLWWAGVAALLFLGSLVTFVVGFRLGGFVVGRLFH
ncbi:hypothetical protein [Nisaea nitritireducens]|uniref:hypothetical protein n=1 Tax=Nisaea nitritireducens TaxID=568392 RepID=UPI0018696A76|nr:hypothetical protein [Nisaea nitritireducens]